MSAETHTETPTLPPLQANADLHLRPFASFMAVRCPHLWERFLAACAQERVAEAGLTTDQFIHRCTLAARNAA